MRLTVKVSRAPDLPARWEVTFDLDGRALVAAARTMSARVDDEKRWWPQAGQARPADDGPIELDRLTEPIIKRSADRPATVAYGKYLFKALFGTSWSLFSDELGDHGDVELVLNWQADDSALHRHVWEFMHDGEDFLALRQDRLIAFVRTVGDSGPQPETVKDVPRLLFVAGSALADPRIHAGAEFVGLLQGMGSLESRRNQRTKASTVSSRMLTEASASRLADRCAEFRPDLVHLIGHGRWEASNGGGRGVVYLRSDLDGALEEPVGAPELVEALSVDKRLPLAVLLSVCDSGVTAGDSWTRDWTAVGEDGNFGGGYLSWADPGPDGETGTDPRNRYSRAVDSEAAAPLAAELVSAGIPLVIAMAGKITDSACRMFTRAVAASISKGLPLSIAVARGRRAVSMHGAHDSKDRAVDWALPTLFASPQLPVGFPLVDVDKARRIRRYFTGLNFATSPVFCGREEFFDVLARLLDPQDDLAVLLAVGKSGPAGGGLRPRVTGGSRLLQELGAAALRARQVPCYVGPFAADIAPTTTSALALAIEDEIQGIRSQFELDDDVPSAALREVAGAAGQEAGDGSLRTLTRVLYGQPESGNVHPPTLARLLREDLRALAADLHAKHPTLFDQDAQVILLFDDVDRYGPGIGGLFEMIDSTGLAPRLPDKLPVVLFGRDNGNGESRFTEEADRLHGVPSVEVQPVRLFVDLPDPDRALFAYRQLLLHPEPGGRQRVLVPRDRSAEWVAHLCQLAKHSTAVYDREMLREMELYADTYKRQFHVGGDDILLQLCGLQT